LSVFFDSAPASAEGQQGNEEIKDEEVGGI
jgi:hypothetical protein